MARGAKKLSAEVTPFSKVADANNVRNIQESKVVYVANLGAQPETLLNIMEAADSVQVVVNLTARDENAVASFPTVEHGRDTTISHRDV